MAFTELEPFPNRSTLLSRHQHHYSKIKEQWVKRERELKEREARSKLEKLKKQVRVMLKAVMDLCHLSSLFSLSSC